MVISRISLFKYLYFFLIFGFQIQCKSKSNFQPKGQGNSEFGLNENDVAAKALEERVSRLQFLPFFKNQLLPANDPDAKCLKFRIEIYDAQLEKIAGVIIDLGMTSGHLVEDMGFFRSNKIKSDENGIAIGSYCPGKSEWNGYLLGRVGTVSANSGKIEVTRKRETELRFLSSTVPTKLDLGTKEAVLELDALNTGAQSCTTLLFELNKQGRGIEGQKLNFYTQPNPPQDAKLAEIDEPGRFRKDVENQTQAFWEGVSQQRGVVRVPVCAGTVEGSLAIFGTWLDDKGRVTEIKAPLIKIRSGIESSTNLSLGFNEVNARTLRGFFDQNSQHKIKTKIYPQRDIDGEMTGEGLYMVAAENGQIQLINGGLSDPGGFGVFVFNSLPLTENRPFLIDTFQGYANAAERCHPLSISTSLKKTSSRFYSYAKLSANWRTTIVYQMKGDEIFYDANGNQKYDGDGDGFWDRNQNGIFDGDDVLTYDHDQNERFDDTGDWFLDLPSPFVDVDENRMFDEDRDILIDDEYHPPNGTRDENRMIWSSMVYPIYTGTSSYAMSRYRIQSDHTKVDESLNLIYKNTEAEKSLLFGSRPVQSQDFWDIKPNSSQLHVGSGEHWSHLFAHGNCGNPVPGGTKIIVQNKIIQAAEYGARDLTHHISPQPGDHVIEPPKRLLKAPNGSNQAVINTDIIDHPYASFGYPVTFKSIIGPCVNQCRGAVIPQSEPAVACDGVRYLVQATLQEPSSLGGEETSLSTEWFFEPVKNCQCAAGARFRNGHCECQEGSVFDGKSRCESN